MVVAEVVTEEGAEAKAEAAAETTAEETDLTEAVWVRDNPRRCQPVSQHNP